MTQGIDHPVCTKVKRPHDPDGPRILDTLKLNLQYVFAWVERRCDFANFSGRKLADTDTFAKQGAIPHAPGQAARAALNGMQSDAPVHTPRKRSSRDRASLDDCPP